jgi:predicted HD phosphohydrolase
MRERHRGHPHFEYCAQFCHLYDQASFDPDYDTMPLSAFEPMLRRVVERPKQSIYSRGG